MPACERPRTVLWFLIYAASARLLARLVGQGHLGHLNLATAPSRPSRSAIEVDGASGSYWRRRAPSPGWGVGIVGAGKLEPCRGEQRSHFVEPDAALA